MFINLIVAVEYVNISSYPLSILQLYARIFSGD
jgi:hypothetical protein